MKRAIESVRMQSFNGWEAVVSVDDPSDWETLEYLSAEAEKDWRITVRINNGEHGQAGNVNNCLEHARGEWIKPLFDDDRLLPQCLETFHRAVEKFPTVVLAGCLAKRYREGKPIRTDRQPTRAYIEIVKQKHAHLAMCLQDFECGSMPSQMLIRAAAIAQGAIMPNDARLVSGIDQLWFADILQFGDRLHLAAVLVEEHQGAHETVTSRASDVDLDNDSILIRRYVCALIPPGVARPNRAHVEQMVYGVRGLHRLFRGKIREGLRLLGRVRSWVGLSLILGWLSRKLIPGYFCATPRERYGKEI